MFIHLVLKPMRSNNLKYLPEAPTIKSLSWVLGYAMIYLHQYPLQVFIQKRNNFIHIGFLVFRVVKPMALCADAIKFILFFIFI